MKNRSDKKRKSLHQFQLYFYSFLFLFVFILTFFTGCFSSLDQSIINPFKNLQQENYSISTDISKSGFSGNFQENLPGLKNYSVLNTGCLMGPGYFMPGIEKEKQNNNLSKVSGITLLNSMLKRLKEYKDKNEIESANKEDVMITEGNSGDDAKKSGDLDNSSNNDSSTKEEASQNNVQNDSKVSFEPQLLDLINQARNKNNLAPLNLNSILNNVAAGRSADMINRNYFGHTTPEGKNIFTILQEKGIGYCSTGENICYANPLSSASPEYALGIWMDSGAHRANILSSNFSQIGIGLASNNDKLVITLVFLN